ncbi:MAG: mechanosensitive ion channel domain-containing protein [Prochlorothrix sp.]|nr:mechanosensitive ion channel domain-containing protein [Prochlorothrix sp.]
MDSISLSNINIPSSIRIDTQFLVAIGVGLALFALLGLPRAVAALVHGIAPSSTQLLYDSVVSPHQDLLGILLFLSALDLLFITLPTSPWAHYGEVAFALGISVFSYVVAFRIFRQFFDVYLLERALGNQRKINSEFLVVSRFLSNVSIVVIIAFIFAQLHQINVVGLIASVGVGGVAIAFASQKILEQGLWGIVLFLDKPFDIDDYIHLQDGTFGRVERIGWRSTRIRISGKGSLIVVPNSLLCKNSVENLSRIQKQISILNLNFYRSIPEHEQALIRRVILMSTEDIFGIDHPLTTVEFRKISHHTDTLAAQAQITFFILGSGEATEDLRQQLLETAQKKIAQQLREYGIAFAIEPQVTNIQSPMSV